MTKSPKQFRRRLATVAVGLAASFGALVAAAPSANALSSIAGPAGYSCGNATISISPPRAWANPGRTEQVAWINQIQRWDPGIGWYNYNSFTISGSFNQYGMNVTSWSGIWYHHNTLNLPVAHQGYYRVWAAVGNATMTSIAPIAGPNAYCWMP